MTQIVSDIPGLYSYSVVHPFAVETLPKASVDYIVKKRKNNLPKKFRWVKLWATWTVARINADDGSFQIIGCDDVLHTGDYIPGELVWGEWLDEPR